MKYSMALFSWFHRPSVTNYIFFVKGEKEMKKMLVAVVIFVGGFVGGFLTLLKWISMCSDVLVRFKKKVIDDFEHLLLGYNTIKTRPYRPYYRSRYRSNYTTCYNDYYKRSFEEDELD